MALTGNQRRFVDEYLVDLDATPAVIRAEYSQKIERETGERTCQNLTSPRRSRKPKPPGPLGRKSRRHGPAAS